MVTDLLDDLSDGGPEALTVAATLWRETAELVLGANARWDGAGKWLLRELRKLDGDRGTNHADALLTGLAAVSRGDVTAMQDAVNAALTPIGGRLFAGYRRGGTDSLGTPALIQPRLEGDGIVLRPFAETDVDVVIEAGRDPLIPLLTTVDAHGDRSDALEYIANQHSRSATGTGWSYAIADAATGRAVGHIGLWRRDIEHGRASVGYWVAASHRRQGYAGRALRILTAWAATIPEITRVELMSNPLMTPPGRPEHQRRRRCRSPSCARQHSCAPAVAQRERPGRLHTASLCFTESVLREPVWDAQTVNDDARVALRSHMRFACQR